jgi:hypothetical protein
MSAWLIRLGGCIGMALVVITVLLLVTIVIVRGLALTECDCATGLCVDILQGPILSHIIHCRVQHID